MGHKILADVNRNSPARFRMADIKYKIDEKILNIFREPEIKKPVINIDWNPKTNDDTSLPQDTNKDLQMALILA